jgi:hypothetical protein
VNAERSFGVAIETEYVEFEIEAFVHLTCLRCLKFVRLGEKESEGSGMDSEAQNGIVGSVVAVGLCYQAGAILYPLVAGIVLFDMNLRERAVQHAGVAALACEIGETIPVVGELDFQVYSTPGGQRIAY